MTKKIIFILLFLLCSTAFGDGIIGDSTVTNDGNQSFSTGYSYIFDSCATSPDAWYTASAGDTITEVACRGKLSGGSVCSLFVYLYTVDGTTLDARITALDTIIITGTNDTVRFQASDVNYGLTDGAKYTLAFCLRGDGGFRPRCENSSIAMRIYANPNPPATWSTEVDVPYIAPVWAYVTANAVSTNPQIIMIN